MSKQFNLINQVYNPLDGFVFNSQSDSTLLITPSADCARLNLRIAQTNLEFAGKVFGLSIPSTIGEMNSDENKSALCLGPDEWMLMAEKSEGKFILDDFSSLATEVLFSLVDVGHRTVGINISGSAAVQVLSSGCPLDLDKMPSGSCTRSVLDKVQILIIKVNNESYRLEIVSSFAEFVWNYLSIASSEFEA